MQMLFLNLFLNIFQNPVPVFLFQILHTTQVSMACVLLLMGHYQNYVDLIVLVNCLLIQNKIYGILNSTIYKHNACNLSLIITYLPAIL